MTDLIWNESLKRFEFSFRVNEHSWDIFKDLIDLFKQLYMSYDGSSKVWYVDDKRIDEILIWLHKEDYKVFCDQSALDKIQNIKDSYKKEIKYLRGLQFDKSIINPDIKLFEYQEKGIQWRIKRNVYLDADDAGLGKTLQEILVFSNLYKQNFIDGIIILVPNGLTYHWFYEILKFVNVFNEDDIGIIDNSVKRQPYSKLEFKNKKILIIPNHIFHHTLLSYKSDYKPTKSFKRIRWEKFVDIKKEWDKKNLLLLIDESHEFKNSKALKTKAIRSIKYSFDYRILMSATPAINHIEDFYSQLELIDKSLIPMSENAFKLWLANRIGTKWDRYAITSYNSKNVKKLKDVIQPVAIQRLKEDIPEMKVEKIIKEIYLQMTIDQSTLYNLIVKEEIKKIKEEYNRLSWQLILDKLPLMCEILDNPLLLKKRRYNNEKINYILDKWDIKKDPKFILLESLLSNYVDYQGEKVVVYGIHPDTLNILTELFKKYNPLVIHGSLDIKNKEKDRALKQQMFNERDENKVMFLSALTSSQGINLQKKCRRIIVYEMTWDTTKFRQLQDRTHRIDSTQNTIVEIPYYPKTIDIVRVKRNLNRIDFNNRLTKEISQTELINLIEGIV